VIKKYTQIEVENKISLDLTLLLRILQNNKLSLANQYIILA